MEVVDHATYQAKSRKDQSALVFYGAARYPDSDTWLTEFFDSASAVGAPAAMSNFSHCTAGDTEIRAARVEPDAKKQLALWKEAQTKIHDDVCAIPLFGLKQVWVHSARVKYDYELNGALSLAPPITESTTVTAP
jgi:peptide/nickel transport system substrate-binding protein